MLRMLSFANVRKQLEAADVHPRDHRHGRSAIDPDGKWRRIGHGEIGVAAPNGIDRGSTRLDRTHVADIGEPLGLQQLLGDVLGNIADAGDLYKSHCRSFEGSLCGTRCRHVAEAGVSGQRECGQKLPP